jgi:pyruvate/2-oxoglutarate dehydrogenase complex dihydrolipoamide acyltransferase (E2) component
MTVPIRVPKLGMSMMSGTIVQWHAADGDIVQAGTPLYTLATDKVENDVDAPASGRLRITGAVEDEYEVGTDIGFIEEI